jgi:replicative DNA helicase
MLSFINNSNIEIIIIDYLQLMTAGGDGKGNREQEISMISRSLKSIAKELDVPILALSQLNRSVETRGGDKKPQLSDLRESGAIEQDADMVTFIYRPEYYGLEVDEDNMPTKGVAKIIIAKHRNGALAEIPLRFRGELAKFENLSDSEITDSFSAQIKPNENFDSTTGIGITFSSRINKMGDDEAPF